MRGESVLGESGKDDVGGGERGRGGGGEVKYVSKCAIQQKMTVKDIDPQTQDRQRKEIENRVKEWKVHIDYIYNKERRLSRRVGERARRREGGRRQR